jgi:hypothetical protein
MFRSQLTPEELEALVNPSFSAPTIEPEPEPEPEPVPEAEVVAIEAES